jgi:hypothetical protein
MHSLFACCIGILIPSGERIPDPLPESDHRLCRAVLFDRITLRTLAKRCSGSPEASRGFRLAV